MTCRSKASVTPVSGHKALPKNPLLYPGMHTNRTLSVSVQPAETDIGGGELHLSCLFHEVHCTCMPHLISLPCQKKHISSCSCSAASQPVLPRAYSNVASLAGPFAMSRKVSARRHATKVLMEGAESAFDMQPLLLTLLNACGSLNQGSAPFSWLLWNGHLGALMGSI